MKTKLIFCVGYRSATSGGFDWYTNAVEATEAYGRAVENCGSLENEPHDIARFDVLVPAHLTGDGITSFIDEDLDDHIDTAIKGGGDMVVSALQAADAKDENP